MNSLNLMPLLAAAVMVCTYCHKDAVRPPAPENPQQDCRVFYDDCIMHPLYQGACSDGGVVLENIGMSPGYAVVRASRPIVRVVYLSLGASCEIGPDWLDQQVVMPDGSCLVPLPPGFYWECYWPQVQELGHSVWDAGLRVACPED